MQRVIVDTGPLVGWFDASDAYHLLVRDFLEDYRGELLTTSPVLGEVCHLLPEHMVGAFLRWVGRGGATLVDMPASALPGLADRIDKYSDLPMDLADASLIWAAEATGVLEVLTIDRRDFGIYRTVRGQTLEKCPVRHACALTTQTTWPQTLKRPQRQTQAARRNPVDGPRPPPRWRNVMRPLFRS